MNYKDMLLTYGVGLGKFLVQRDDDGNRIVEDIGGLVVAHKGRDGALRMQDPTPRSYPSLATMKALVLRALGPVSTVLLPEKATGQAPAHWRQVKGGRR